MSERAVMSSEFDTQQFQCVVVILALQTYKKNTLTNTTGTLRRRGLMDKRESDNFYGIQDVFEDFQCQNYAKRKRVGNELFSYRNKRDLSH